jgi:hypothetical protein
MYIGQKILLKHENKLQEGIIENVLFEDLEIKLENGEIIQKKFWEVRKINEK